MIENAISNTVYIRLVTTTSIVAKLAVCAVLIAGAAACAQAAARATPEARPSSAKLSQLDREWKQLHSRRQHGALDRLVACREYDRCEGLTIHPALVAADDGDQGGASPLTSGAASVNP